MTLQQVLEAQGRLEGVAQRTPLTYSTTFSQMAGAQVHLKCENLQRTGSFKIRGAYNRLSMLTAAERKRGVIAASAGNHAQGVALAARLLGIKATMFMPESTPLAKVAATQGYGADVRIEGESYEAAYEAALREQARGGAVFVHPFDDEAVIAGQGTIACEILDELPEVDAIVVPVGGGGLIAGIATAAKALRPSVRVFGVEGPTRTAKAEGEEQRGATIADGINVREPGTLTLPLIEALVDEVVTVEEEDISRAMLMLLERSKLVVEGAGAVGLAALLAGRLQLAGKTVAVVLSGGNVDVNLMARIIEHGLATAGRYLIFETWLPDKPGELLNILQVLLDERVNILSVEHRRPASFPEVEVMLTVETRDSAHGERLLAHLRERGYRVNRLELGG
ncbi:MAG TPA: threonine ammonia-lyase [Chloroflexota bacterium]